MVFVSDGVWWSTRYPGEQITVRCDKILLVYEMNGLVFGVLFEYSESASLGSYYPLNFERYRIHGLRAFAGSKESAGLPWLATPSLYVWNPHDFVIIHTYGCIERWLHRTQLTRFGHATVAGCIQDQQPKHERSWSCICTDVMSSFLTHACDRYLFSSCNLVEAMNWRS